MDDQDARGSLYQPLESPDLVRLVGLPPDTESEPARTLLHIYHWEKAPSFDALSYKWEQSNKYEHHIVYDGHKLPVSRDLHYTLQYLRHDEDSRLLWIDLISITQQDRSEVSCCVLMMKRMYKAAARNLCCIEHEDLLLLEDFTRRTDRLDHHQRAEPYFYQTRDIFHSTLRITSKDLQDFEESVDWGQPDSIGNETQKLLEQEWLQWYDT
jgi:hypothetical protein